MKFTDLFIKRPVLSIVVSMLIFLFGINSIYKMQIRQYPKMENTVITIMTGYPGADAELIAGFITTPLESAVASAEGIDYMTSSSQQGLSTITLNIKLNFDPQIAFTDVMSKVQQTLNQLPKESQQPVILKKSDSSTALMYISLDSKDMTPQQITDYATRVVQPQLQTVDGVAKADILGGQTYSMRIFMDPIKMAALNVTPADVSAVLASNNFLTAAGNTKSEYVAINVTAKTDLNNVDEFERLIVKSDKGSIIRLRDIAKVELGSQNYDSSVTFNSKKAVFISITPTPTANPLTVINDARKLFPSIVREFPPSLTGTIVYDATAFIRASIHEVMETIIEAAVIVIIVIFLFLGSVRSVLIPVVTIPLSLVGVCTLMLILGYSINLLTLLAFVLAIGLVVDDAIVVVENVHRHLEEGKTPFEAAIIGAREIATPVIAMTITLAAVYAPIGFMSGLTGALFKEFAFTLASAVIISGVIALTLSPMMCSKILSAEATSGKFAIFLDEFFNKLKRVYQNTLHSLLNTREMMLLLAGVVILMLPYLYSNTAAETAPDEDQGFFFVMATAPQYATLNYIEAFTKPFDAIYKSFPETENYFTVNMSQPISGMVLKPWDQRKKSQFALKEPLQKELSKIAGLNAFAIVPPPLPGGGGGPAVQFVIKTTNDFQSLMDVSNKLTEKARSSGLFIYIDNSLKFNQPQVEFSINRAKASEMGLDMRALGSSLTSALSGNYINYFNLEGRSYQVIPQLARKFRLTIEQLGQIYVKTLNGTMVPLSTVVTPTEKTQPNAATHFQQLNSATIQAVMTPGKTLGQGLEFLQKAAQEVLPKGFTYDYGGESRQFMQEGSALIFAFLFAIVVIFLVLAAQYESFRDPLIVLISVPMSICGALIPLNLGVATINIYTQVGLITLIGLISKHGILIVDFANHLQREKNLDKRAAVEEAAGIRLRPILMTTAAMVFGVIPLLIASGAGAASRFDIGLVISTGLLIGTCFTLFVVPTLYTYLAEDHRHKPNEPVEIQ
ncbi:efflux RND transporter permease subunit [Legionella pneumophila]|uniref:Hydrophobic/amphiphilic exporter-1 (Mainly G-bacteria), HAE1 family n=1 Tax=Legionella pneumophila subsp. pascullei TaxID=91890 RepID=A0AAX2IUZ8_LEGPN|nr:efflux RND transporter permease subunit [Legionella pneumophila]AMP91745.1 acriflavine resistance protein B [Legionella pneumophila subsp. pascullei]SQG89559.1 hydrophobic/amphiphilic exporter-1 (mainly G-bacteria), HAE1 family [Legionella pneumophila subsp. pascullei]VEH04951.1 hydrophobic/amphiphilic exporter-1 (mainly G-bacteria), HAE1 family [Legionella pneumophila subsp. pascullei]HAU3862598.1 MMPL family transporter [Legionella pneumophila]HDU8261336.1 efflux RND transporter permease 